jgi:hypothetical protein
MTLLTLEIPPDSSWAYEVELSGTVYLLRGLLLKPPNVKPYYLIDLLLPDDTPIELGMKLTPGYRMAFRGRNPIAPKGKLFVLRTTGGEQLLCYEPTV